jgi:aspartate kinase
MGLLVQKFGGTSVGTPERILRVAQHISQTQKEGHQVCVVVSAMGRTTDDLLALASQVSRFPPSREVDMLLTAGERISMALLSMALEDLGVSAVSFTGSQSGIITTGHHRRARIKRILGDRVREALNQGSVAIVAGFQGVSEKREITTLGRGGSDTTAVALASVLKADRCDIFTDVDGVFSADPRTVKSAKLIPRISHAQMVEFALRGASVLHARSVEIAEKYGVPLWVRNSLKYSSLGKFSMEGTEVISPKNESEIEASQVTAVTSDGEKILLEVELARASVAASLWDFATEHHLLCLVPDFNGTKVRFFIDVEAQDEWTRGLHDLSTNGFVKSYVFHSDLHPVSLIGSRLTQDGRILAAVVHVLEGVGISLGMGQSTSLAMTFAVPKVHVDEIVQTLHDRLI